MDDIGDLILTLIKGKEIEELNEFRAQLKDPVTSVRRDAIYALRQKHDPRAILILESALDDEDSGVRALALNSLMAFKNDAHIIACIRLLGDPDERLRSTAYNTLWRYHPLVTRFPSILGSIGALVVMRNDSRADVRKNATNLIMRIGDSCTTAELIEEFQSQLKESWRASSRKYKDKIQASDVQFFSNIMKEISAKKDQLASDNDVLLLDIPKPPKKGQMFQSMRKERVRNG